MCGSNDAAPSSGERRGKLIVVSGPSGVGKGTVLRELLLRYPETLTMAISATTRAARPGEREGEDYHFLSPEQFAELRQQGEFLECCEVFGQGYWYGTLRSEVEPSLAVGKSVILEIDVEGTEAVLAQYPDAVTVFVEPGSVAELERRLRARATESEAEVQRRLAVAKNELQRSGIYKYQVENDVVAEAVARMSEILDRELSNGSNP